MMLKWLKPASQGQNYTAVPNYFLLEQQENFPNNIQGYLGKKTTTGNIIQNDQDLALYLLKTANVVTIPGSKFDRSGHLRLAYAINPITIEIGIQQMAKALDQLQ